MFRILVIAAFLFAADVQAQDWHRPTPTRCREECESVLVRINTYRVTRVREWDGTVYEYRTLIGVRYERQIWCERVCRRYPILED